MRIQAAFFSLLTLALAITTGCKMYRYEDEPGTATAINLNPDEAGLQESLFVRDALREGSNEVHIARLGVERAQNIDLKLLAQRIVDDRTSAMADLRLIARTQMVAPAAVTNEEADAALRFQDLSGAKFDQMYVRHVLQSHRDEVKKFRAAARNLRNTDLREFAGRILPVVQEHLRIAENIGTIAALDIEINEPAGAQRTGSQRDPFYQGDQKLPQLYKE